MNALRSFQRAAYLASRTAGDLNAAQRGGPERLAKRIAKRAYHRKLIGLLRKGRAW